MTINKWYWRMKSDRKYKMTNSEITRMQFPKFKKNNFVISNFLQGSKFDMLVNGTKQVLLELSFLIYVLGFMTQPLWSDLVPKFIIADIFLIFKLSVTFKICLFDEWVVFSKLAKCNNRGSFTPEYNDKMCFRNWPPVNRRTKPVNSFSELT